MVLCKIQNKILFLQPGLFWKKTANIFWCRKTKKRFMGCGAFAQAERKKGESFEGTAIREAQEELNYQIELGRRLGIFPGNSKGSQLHVFEAEIIGGELKFPEDEIMDVKWFTLEEIKSMADKLRHKWIPEVIRQAQK
jgi:8-oxo-dGTP pyrophosphatase MutT (NUDIX family)